MLEFQRNQQIFHEYFVIFDEIFAKIIFRPEQFLEIWLISFDFLQKIGLNQQIFGHYLINPKGWFGMWMDLEPTTGRFTSWTSLEGPERCWLVGNYVRTVCSRLWPVWAVILAGFLWVAEGNGQNWGKLLRRLNLFGRFVLNLLINQYIFHKILNFRPMLE
jgi:hypothetical protein